MAIRPPDIYGFEGEPDDDRVPIVPFVPFRCPRCGRHKPITYKVLPGGLRYHRCQACGTYYRSWEVPASDVQNFTPPATDSN